MYDIKDKLIKLEPKEFYSKSSLDAYNLLENIYLNTNELIKHCYKNSGSYYSYIQNKSELTDIIIKDYNRYKLTISKISE